MLFVVLVLTIVILFLIHIEIKRLRIHKQFKHVYSDQEFPVIGNVPFFKLKKSNALIQITKELGTRPIAKFTSFGSLIFVVNDPHMLQKIFLSPIFHKRSDCMRFLEQEKALFSTIYANWKPIRKPLNVTFAKKRMFQWIPKLNKHSDLLCDKFISFIHKGDFDVNQLVSYSEIDLFSDIFLDIQSDTSEKWLKAAQVATNVIGERIMNPLLYLDPIFRLTSQGRDLKKALKDGHDVLDEQVRPDFIAKRADMTNGNYKIHDRNLLDDLCEIVKYKELLTYEEILENIKTLYTAGFETLTQTICFALFILALHPDVDAKVYAEIQEHYQEGTYLDYDTIKKCNYLDMVVKEILRIFPVAPLSMRDNITDVEIDGIGMVPKGTTFLIIVYTLHRLKSIWGPDADKFNPENFTPENVAKRHPFSYVPFGNGGRNCIGLHYANLNMRFILIKILAKYRFSTNMKYEELRLKYGVAMKLDHEYLLQVHLRSSTGSTSSNI